MTKVMTPFPPSWQDEFPNVKLLNLDAVAGIPEDDRFNVLYVRVSTEEQSKRGYSIQEQGPIALTFASDKEWNTHPVVVIIDDGQSATIGWKEPDKKTQRYRVGFTRLHELIRAGRVANILAAYIDRLSRNDYFTQALTHDCRYYGTRIHADEKEDLQTDDNALLWTVNGAVASETARGTKRKVTDNVKRRVSEGLPPGTVPYGWKHHHLTEEEVAQHLRPWVETNEEQKKWVLRMREWFLSGLTAGQIATKLEACGAPTATGKSHWSKTVVISILLNPFHAGKFRHKDKLIDGRHAQCAFWGMDDHEEMLRIYERRNTCRHSFEHSDRHLLGGLINCGTCGAPLRYGNDDRHKGGPRYYCENGCPRIRARVDLVDKYVLQSLKELVAHPLALTMVEQEAEAILRVELGDDTELIKRLESQRKGLKRALKRAYDGWCREKASDDAYNSEKQELDAEMKLVEGELAEHAGRRHRRDELVHRLKEVVETVRDFDGIWGDLERRERREVLHLVSERLVLENQDSTAVLKVKLFFLDEKEFALPSYRHASAWKIGGFQGLLATWLACAKLRLDGLSNREIADKRGLDIRTVCGYWGELKKTMRVDSRDEALELLRPHLEAMDPDLLMRERHGRALGNDRPLTDRETGALLARLETGDFEAAARKLGVTRSCFNSRLNNAYRKLGASKFDEALAKARERGIAV